MVATLDEIVRVIPQRPITGHAVQASQFIRQGRQPKQHQGRQEGHSEQAQSTTSSLFALDVVSASARLPEVVDRDNQQHGHHDRAYHARRESNVMEVDGTDLKAHSLTDKLHGRQSGL